MHRNPGCPRAHGGPRIEPMGLGRRPMGGPRIELMGRTRIQPMAEPRIEPMAPQDKANDRARGGPSERARRSLE